jgi:hypothetical protein
MAAAIKEETHVNELNDATQEKSDVVNVNEVIVFREEHTFLKNGNLTDFTVRCCGVDYRCHRYGDHPCVFTTHADADPMNL